MRIPKRQAPLYHRRDFGIQNESQSRHEQRLRLRQSQPKPLPEEYQDLLRIRTISTQPQHADDVAKAAEWLRAMMLRIGMERADVILMPEGRCPLVLGEWTGAGADAPTILIYCHYDVQPAEVADGWDTEPFEPTIIGERLYCRGAVDSKLHVMANLKAVESWLAADEKPKVNIKVVLEGEEESGSENINAFIAAHPERLAADFAVVSDGAILAPDQPSLTYGLRGATALEVHVQASQTDLHSGHWGGSVHNPPASALRNRGAAARRERNGDGARLL